MSADPMDAAVAAFVSDLRVAARGEGLGLGELQDLAARVALAHGVDAERLLRAAIEIHGGDFRIELAPS